MKVFGVNFLISVSVKVTENLRDHVVAYEFLHRKSSRKKFGIINYSISFVVNLVNDALNLFFSNT